MNLLQRLADKARRGVGLLETDHFYASVAMSHLPVRTNYIGLIACETPLIGIDWEFIWNGREHHIDVTLYLLNFYLYLCFEG